MVASGFGVNYKALQTNWTKDIAYFNAIGLHHVRPNLADAPIPWSAGDSGVQNSYAYWRLCASTFKAAGFWVSFGVSGPQGLSGTNLTSTLWGQYVTSVVAEATYLSQNGLLPNVFELGNELEDRIDASTIADIPALHTRIRSLNASVKAAVPGIVTGYACYDAFDGVNSTYDEWIANGKGTIDYISLHPYGNISVKSNTIASGGFSGMTRMINFFGSGVYVSEFNLDSFAGNLKSISDSQAVTWMTSKLSTLQTSGVTPMLLYMWCGTSNANNDFAGGLRVGGAMNPAWFVFFDSRQRYYTPRATAPNRTSVSHSSVARGTTVIDRYSVP